MCASTWVWIYAVAHAEICAHVTDSTSQLAKNPSFDSPSHPVMIAATWAGVLLPAEMRSSMLKVPLSFAVKFEPYCWTNQCK